jgi:hypothetical protein
VKDRASHLSNLVQSAEQIICERQDFTLSELTVLYDIITVRLGYHKFCAMWVLEMLMDAHKTQK